GGTCAESIWLINYEAFPASAETLKDKWSPGRVHIASHFRPGLLPEDFEGCIEEILRRYFGAPVLDSLIEQDLEEVSDLREVVLNWEEMPRDLDLHGWLEATSGSHHIYYGEKGTLDA